MLESGAPCLGPYGLCPKVVHGSPNLNFIGSCNGLESISGIENSKRRKTFMKFPRSRNTRCTRRDQEGGTYNADGISCLQFPEFGIWHVGKAASSIRNVCLKLQWSLSRPGRPSFQWQRDHGPLQCCHKSDVRKMQWSVFKLLTFLWSS